MMRTTTLLLCAATALVCAATEPLVLNGANTSFAFNGIGGLSGGGATTRLLVDYKEPERSQVLDYLFKPNFGASLQILKVEIGGDSQSTDGTETSHMHSPDSVDYNSGYEWWLMNEAKKRNPDIKLYGLPWAFPGWVGKGSGSPFQYPNLTASYITKWVEGARSVYGHEIDYIGVWNERSSDATYVKTLRGALNDAGHSNVQIVARDGGADICDDLAKDPEYAAAVSIIGLHYPSDYSDYSKCHDLNKPVWASEESSSYDDLNGAACWARVITSHWVLSKMTASIMWNLVGAYMHGTNWYASSMMTTVEPWSGHYSDQNSVVWATAHVTQFTEVGWKYLEVGDGSGELPNGGFYATFTNGSEFTMTIAKISYDHAPCTRPKLPTFNVSAEEATFSLKNFDSVKAGQHLSVWYSNFQNFTDTPLFERQTDIVLDSTMMFSINIPVGAFITVSTITEGPSKGSFPDPPASQPHFPLPYSDNFDSYPESQEARYFSDQIGAFEIHKDVTNTGNLIMRQMVPELPIGWSDHGSNGPLTVIGMREWQDVSVSVSFLVEKPNSTVPADIAPAAGCVGARSDQMSDYGIFFCVYIGGKWTLSYGGASQATGLPKNIITQGTLSTAITYEQWVPITINVTGKVASASANGKTVVTGQAISDIDTGFASMGGNTWVPHVEFDNFAIVQLIDGDNWSPKDTCPAANPGAQLANKDCASNGMSLASQEFELKADWSIVHIPSGLCATAKSLDANSVITLETCASGNPLQEFKNDYTRIRNTVTSVYMDTDTSLWLTAKGNTVGLGIDGADWKSWSYFPNTKQLRNQYVGNNQSLGYPKCLSTC